METRKNERSVPAKVPVLKITINKKYNNRSSPYPSHSPRESVNPSKQVATWSSTNEKPVNEKPVAEPEKSDRSEVKSVGKTLTARQLEDADRSKRGWRCKGDLSRENVRCRTHAERLRHLNTKAQRELEILTTRLKALKERHKYEKKQIGRLNRHLGLRFKDIPDPPGNFCKDQTDKGNEDECERMLREARRMKQSLEETPVMKRLNDKLTKGEWFQSSGRLGLRTSGNGEVWSGQAFDTRRNGTSIMADQNEENAIEIKEELIDNVDN